MFKKGLIPWNKTKSDSTCAHCGRLFHIAPSRLRDTKIKRGVFCSRKCKDAYRIGKSSWNKNVTGDAYKAHYRDGFRGIFGNSLGRWNGNKKDYYSLHYWVRSTLGKPDICSKCGNRFSGKYIHWANISGEYRKDAIDWIRLCSKCHFEFDRVYERRL